VSTASQLESRLEAELTQAFALAQEKDSVVIKGELPALDFLGIDLSSGRIAPKSPPANPPKDTAMEMQVSARVMAGVAKPLFWAESAQVELTLTAQEAELDIVRDGRQRRWLMLTRARHGTLVLHFAKGQFEDLVVDCLGRVAAQHGITVEQAEVKVNAVGEDAARLQIALTMRKSFVRGSVQVGGELRLDRNLALHLADLSCEGKGVVGSLVATVLQPRLEALEATPLPLLGPGFAAIKNERVSIKGTGEGAWQIQAWLSG